MPRLDPKRGCAMDVHSTPLSMLAVSPRTLNAQLGAHITKVGEVLVMSDDELLRIRNFSDKCLAELDQGLSKMNTRRE